MDKRKGIGQGMRDRLIEILLDGVTFTDEYKFPARKQAEYVADRLLANGVIVQSHGHWTIKTDDYDCEYMVCSCCGEEFYNADEDTVDRTPKYCPNCGAKMDGLVEREGKG